MMPDITQQGKSVNPEQVIESAPAVMMQGVTKQYGHLHALNGVSLAISGGVTGILGSNGAGKSTLFKLMVGRIRANQGSIHLFGQDPWKNPGVYSRIGYVPEHEKMHDWMTALDFISTFARLHGLTRDQARKEAIRVLDFVDLGDVMDRQIGRFSKGMRQRVKIAHALVNDPELIILDEPLAGCDPLARTTIMNVIRELGRSGKTILVSSHILHEIERITEQIVILHKGKLIAFGNLHAIRELLDAHPHTIRLTTEEPKELAKKVLDIDSVKGITLASSNILDIQTHDLGKTHTQLPGLIVESGISVEGIDNPDDDLEHILHFLTGGGD